MVFIRYQRVVQVVKVVQEVKVDMLFYVFYNTKWNDDKIQINMANSTGALSGLVDAAEGLDSLHLDGFSLFTDGYEDLIG